MEKAMAPHSSTLAWKIPWMEKPGRLQSVGSQRVGYFWAASLHQLPQSAQTHMHPNSVMPSNHRILCHPLLLPPSVFPSIRVFSQESALCNNWLTYWSFSFSINSSNEYSGLISIRIKWFYLLAVQGTLCTTVFSSTIISSQTQPYPPR